MQLHLESNILSVGRAVVAFPPRQTNATKRSTQYSCMACIHNSKCLAQGLESDEIVQFDRAVNHSLRINTGKHIYRMWDPVRSVFTVLSGSVKIYTLSENGSEHINGFYQSGDLIATDAIGVDLYPSSAIALEPTIVCEIPVSLFYRYAKEMPQLQSSLIRQISSSLRNEEQHSVLLGQKSAEQRLALFLLNLSKRLKRNGYESAILNAK